MDVSAPDRDRLRDRLQRLPPVRWLHPAQLVRVGAQVAQARMFGAFGARRENEAAQPAEIYDLSSPNRTVWIDYTADVGDGFDSTYAVARSIAVDALPDAETAGHGELLVLGGDQTYPVASEANYRARTMSVYRAALPERGDESPALLAIPGNHDWYDGLTAFLRVFCQGWLADVPLPTRDGPARVVDPSTRTSTFIGGWRTVQSRSYFATRLPYGWWLWGTDIQFDTYIDAPQIAYFIEAATHLVEGDSIILCTAKPSWAGAGDPETTERFIARTLGDQADAVRLICAGDRHHYSRYVPVGDTGPAALITCGGGGAYLSATHHLPDTTAFGRWPDDEAGFRRTRAFPDPTESRELARGFWRLPWRNPALGTLIGPLYALLLWLLAATQPGDGAVDRLLGYSLADTRLAPGSLPALIGCVLVVAATLGVARPSSAGRALAGLLHGAAHLGVLLAVTYAVGALSWPNDAFAASLLITLAVVLACGVIGPYVLAIYLFCCQSVSPMHSNELFAALRVVDFKSYLRLQIGPDGVRVHPIGLRTVPRVWTPSADGPLLEPVDGSPAESIEEPFTVTPRRSG